MIPSGRIGCPLGISAEVVFEEVDASFCFGKGASCLHDSSDKDLRVWIQVLGAGRVDREEPIRMV